MGRDSDDRRSEQRKPDFSNVQSGSSSTARRAPGGPPQVRTHVVKQGETLSAIAEREYGDPGQWRKIYDANRDTIQDPDLIHPGDTLKLPPA